MGEFVPLTSSSRYWWSYLRFMSTLPAYWSDEFVRGSDYDETFTLTFGGEPINLTGAVAEIELTDRYGGVRTYTSVSNPDNVKVAVPTNGQVAFLLSEVETATYQHGCQDIKLSVAFPTGMVNTYIVGTLCAGS